MMSTEARELYNFCIGTLGQRFDEEAILYGELWVRGLVRGAAQQYLHDFCSKGTRISDIWTDKDVADVAWQIIKERRPLC